MSTDKIINNKAKFTCFTSQFDIGKEKIQSKKHGLETGKATPLHTGKSETLELTIREFAKKLLTLDSKTAYCYGLGPKPKCDIVSKRKLKELNKAGMPTDGMFTRSQENFIYGAYPGIFTWDYDDHGKPLTMEEFQKMVYDVCPEVIGVPHFFHVSSSSNICHNGDGQGDKGEEIIGIKGQRLYIMVQDASLIPQAIIILISRLWLKGYAGHWVSIAGIPLEDSRIDPTYKKGETLDFVGGPILGYNLERNVSMPEIINEDGEFLDLSTLEQINKGDLSNVASAMRKSKSETVILAEPIRLAHAEKRVRLEHPHVLEDEDRERLVQNYVSAVKGNVLFGDCILYLSNGEQITVSHLLYNPSKYDGMTMCDPVEPEYMGGDPSKAKFYFNDPSGKYGQPIIRSFAHGGKSYRLKKSTRRILYEEKRMDGHIDEIFNALGSSNEIFALGTELVSVDKVNAETIPLTLSMTRLELNMVFEYTMRKVYKDGLERIVEIYTPELLARTFIDMKPRFSELNRLSSITNSPMILKDGRVISDYGYDKESGQFNCAHNWKLETPSDYTDEDFLKDYDLVMSPFSEFVFDGIDSESNLYSYVLTATMRPSLNIVPMYAFDAPDASAGKTLASDAMSMLITGSDGGSKSVGTEGEMEKYLAVCATTCKAVITIDNYDAGYAFNMNVFNQHVTAKVHELRVLGLHKNAYTPNVSIVQHSGINFSFVGESAKRGLIIRINPGVEVIEDIKHSFCPIEMMKKKRRKIVEANIRMLSKGIEEGKKMGKEGKFPQWNRSVGATCLIAQRLLKEHRGIDIGNPMDVLKNVEVDPMREYYSNAFELIEKLMGDKSFTAKELMDNLRDEYPEGMLSGERVYELEDILPIKEGKSRALSGALRKLKDKIIDGRQLAFKKDGGKKGGKYHMVRIHVVKS